MQVVGSSIFHATVVHLRPRKWHVVCENHFPGGFFSDIFSKGMDILVEAGCTHNYNGANNRALRLMSYECKASENVCENIMEPHMGRNAWSK